MPQALAIPASTRRLMFRRLGHDDTGRLLTVYGDPEVMRFSVRGVRDPSGIAEFLAWNDEQIAAEGVGLWGVYLGDMYPAHGFVGVAGLICQEVEGLTELEVGYRLAKPYWGRGLATEAAAACRDLAFGSMHRTRLISLIDPRNTSSCRVAEKIGMHAERTVIKWSIPIIVYAIQSTASHGAWPHEHA